MIAIAYARRSAKSEEKTVSLETQIEHIRGYCERQGFDLRHVVEHDGVSGTKRSRFASLDKALKEFNASCVVYYYQDRMARDVGILDYFKSLNKRGIQVHEVAGTGKVETGSAIGRMVVGFRAVADAAYAEIIGEKTRDALAKKRGAGKRYTNIPPLGYEYIDGAMVENPEEQRALETLRRCAAAGLGARRALKVLEAGGYNGRASLKAIHRAIRNCA
jgi:DNA invertase Pin-like site-specific DNA recombinase